MSRTHGGINSTSKGIRVPDYYPQAITPDLFQRAQAQRTTRKRIGGKNSSALRNLFAGIVKCQHCGAPMYYELQQRKGRRTGHKLKEGMKAHYIARTNRSYLICNNRRRGNMVNIGHGEMGQCRNSGKPRYEFLETAVLDTVLGLAMDDVSFSMPDQVAELEAQIAEHNRLTDAKRFRLSNLQLAIEEAFSSGLAKKAAELEAEIADDDAKAAMLEKELEREKGQTSPEEHLERVKGVRASLHAEDEEERYAARAKVLQALKRVVTMTCDMDGITTVMLANGLMAWRFDREGQPVGEPIDLRYRLDLHHGLIPRCIDQYPCAHWRIPMDMMCQG